jgi:carboxymethylenebutenolidase
MATMNVGGLKGESFSAYVAEPATTPAPIVLILQEIFGVNKNVRRIADRFAERGYLAIAPDLFWRIEPNVELSYRKDDMERAMSFLGRFDETLALVDIAATVRAARALPAGNGTVVAAGFCLGGLLAFRTAVEGEIDAASSFYGGGIEHRLGEIPRLRCPLQLHYGGSDQHIPAATVEMVAAAVAGAPSVELYVYPDAVHGFFNDGRPGYDPAPAELALNRTLDLFGRMTAGNA